MFLENLRKEIPQISYNGRKTLSDLSKLDISTIDNRLVFILNVVQYANSLWIKRFYDWTSEPNLLLVKNSLAKCNTYYSTINIVWSLLKWIVENFSYEIIKENNWEFDFSKAKWILSWKKKPEEFVKTPVNKNVHNTIWAFKWISGKEYNGKWKWELMSLKAVDILDILKWYNTKDIYKDMIDFLFTNEELVKKDFRQVRLAGITIIQEIIDPTVDSKFKTTYRKELGL